MAEITLGGKAIKTAGELPAVGTMAPGFKLTNSNLEERSLNDYAGKKLILNIFPSVDTGVCAASIRQFNEKAGAMEGVQVLNISRDLPFAHKRFCASEGIEAVENLSEYKDHNFSTAYGVAISEGAFSGLLSRAVMVLDVDGKVLYTEQVPEIGQEPNYEQALAALS